GLERESLQRDRVLNAPDRPHPAAAEPGLDPKTAINDLSDQIGLGTPHGETAHILTGASRRAPSGPPRRATPGRSLPLPPTVKTLGSGECRVRGSGLRRPRALALPRAAFRYFESAAFGSAGSGYLGSWRNLKCPRRGSLPRQGSPGSCRWRSRSSSCRAFIGLSPETPRSRRRDP